MYTGICTHTYNIVYFKLNTALNQTIHTSLFHELQKLHQLNIQPALSYHVTIINIHHMVRATTSPSHWGNRQVVWPYTRAHTYTYFIHGPSMTTWIPVIHIPIYVRGNISVPTLTICIVTQSLCLLSHSSSDHSDSLPCLYYLSPSSVYLVPPLCSAW